MAKPSTNKRPDTEDGDPISFLEHMGVKDITVTQEEAAKDEPKVVDVDALVARLDRLEQDNVSLQQSNLALMAAPKQQTASVAVPPPVSIVADLPDPVAEPENYSRMLEDRIIQRIDGAVSASENATAERARSSKQIEVLWDEFSNAYPDHAKNTKLTEFVATKVAETADAKGLNLDTYMFTNSQQFFKDIVSEMDVMLPKVEPKEVKDDPKKAEEDELNRTGGIFGGLETGGSPSSGSDIVEGDLISDLTELQRKSGYF